MIGGENWFILFVLQYQYSKIQPSPHMHNTDTRHVDIFEYFVDQTYQPRRLCVEAPLVGVAVDRPELDPPARLATTNPTPIALRPPPEPQHNQILLYLLFGLPHINQVLTRSITASPRSSVGAQRFLRRRVVSLMVIDGGMIGIGVGLTLAGAVLIMLGQITRSVRILVFLERRLVLAPLVLARPCLRHLRCRSLRNLPIEPDLACQLAHVRFPHCALRSCLAQSSAEASAEGGSE